jgi:hypothetical protein
MDSFIFFTFDLLCNSWLMALDRLLLALLLPMLTNEPLDGLLTREVCD